MGTKKMAYSFKKIKQLQKKAEKAYEMTVKTLELVNEIDKRTKQIETDVQQMLHDLHTYVEMEVEKEGKT